MSRRHDTPPQAVENAGSLLTPRERELLANFRGVTVDAQNFLIRTSDQFRRTFPAQRPRLMLVDSPKGGKA